MAGQLTGNGQTEVDIYTNMLGIGRGMRRITHIQKEITCAVKLVSDKVIKENIRCEINTSDKCKFTNKPLLSVCVDTRWGTQAKFASTDTVFTAAGNHTNLFMNAQAFSNCCILCTKGIPHSPLECAKNIDGHAKQMEAIGARMFVLGIFEEWDAYVREIVADDDSSIRRILKHKFKKLFELGLIPERPRYESGALKPDNGELPVEHVEIHFFSDRNHRVRSIAKDFFILGRKKLSECIGTTHDAERLKRNLSYAIRGNCDKTIDDLTTAVKSVLEHHFNNHEFCGDWCQCKGKTEEELKDLKLKYRDKSIHAKFYAQLQPIFQKCLDKIADVYHTYNSNINEGFNKLICKFVPKDRNFNGTKEYKPRVNIAVCIDSVGYLETYVDLFNEMDMKLSYNLVRKLHSMNTRKKYKRNYQQKIEVKRKRIQTFHDKLRKGEA